jgi:hypothetical protein
MPYVQTRFSAFRFLLKQGYSNNVFGLVVLIAYTEAQESADCALQTCDYGQQVYTDGLLLKSL